MKKLFASLATVALLGAVATAGAAVETFDGFVAGATPGGTSSLTNGAWTDGFGPPDVVAESTNPLPALAPSQYLSVDNFVDQELTLTADAITGTGAGTYVAFAFRINSVSATAAENTLDVIRFQTSSGNAFGLVIIDGLFRMANTNGWTATRVLYNDVTTSLTEDEWVVIAGRIVPSTTTDAAKAKWWQIDPEGVAAPVVLYDDFGGSTGATNTNVLDLSVVNFGATYELPIGGTGTFSISLDHLLIDPASTYADEAAFLSAINGIYVSPASIEDWTMYR